MWNKGCAIRQLRSAAAIAVLCLTPSVAGADVVLQWNEIAVRTLTTQTPGLSPFAQARFAAIVQLAVFDAVNATTREFKGYLGSPVAPTAAPIVAPLGASGEAAAIVAAHDVLVHYFSGNAMTLDADRDASLAAIPDGAAKTNGMATGAAAAAGMIAERVGDGSSPVAFYLPPSAPPAGEWDITPGCPTDSQRQPARRHSCSTGRTSGRSASWCPRPATGATTSAPRRRRRSPASRYAQDYDEVKTGRQRRPAPSDQPTGPTVARFYAANVAHVRVPHGGEATRRTAAATRSPTTHEFSRSSASPRTTACVASFTAKYHYMLLAAGDGDPRRRRGR